MIFDLSIKSKDKLIKLPNKQHLEISKGHTEFSLKSEEQFQKELMKIDFYPPHENDECKRITVVRFNNMKNISFCDINDTLNNYHILCKNKDTCIINLAQSLFKSFQ